MFVSLPQYELQMSEVLSDPGSRHWRVVEMPLHAPWYLLTVVRADPGAEGWATSYTLCFAWDTDLVDAIMAIDVTRIRGLVAMIPAWASPTGQWSSRQINEVWLDVVETGKIVTLLDVAGKKLDAGMLIEPPKAGPSGELLLRLDDTPRKLRLRSPDTWQSRRRASRAK